MKNKSVLFLFFALAVSWGVAEEIDDSPFPPPPPPFDLVLSQEVLFYGINEEEGPLNVPSSKQPVPVGGRYVFEEWNPYVHNPMTIEVEVKLRNTGKQSVHDIDLILSVSPKIGFLKAIGETMTDDAATAKGSIWYPAMFVKKQVVHEIKGASTMNVAFTEIDFKGLKHEITKIAPYGYVWPSFMKFSIMALPKLSEADISNNTCEKVLKIHTWD
jgi:hypothetical protein